jgi:hypothetical protein
VRAGNGAKKEDDKSPVTDERELTREEIAEAAVLAELAEATCRNLGIRFAPEALLTIHRGIYERIEEHNLAEELLMDHGDLVSGLEAISAHVLESEDRWRRHGRKTRGRWWDALARLYESYYRGVYATVGVMIQILERHGLEPPSPEELGLPGTP